MLRPDTDADASVRRMSTPDTRTSVCVAAEPSLSISPATMPFKFVPR